MNPNPKPPGRRTTGAALALALALATAAESSGADAPKAADDLTFRPTVVVLRGSSQGSGTVIASVAGEALVLTAAHVVRGEGPVTVELHRFNLGVERSAAAKGWPLSIKGEVAASDKGADVAVVRLKLKTPLPYVARLAASGDEPKRGAVILTVGVDGKRKLESWESPVVRTAWFVAGDAPFNEATLRNAENRADFDPEAGARPFLITRKAPVGGRSGGGLYADGTRLAGVCVGRIDLSSGAAVGVFAGPDSVHKLLRDHGLDAAVARSVEARERPAVTPAGAPRPAINPAR